MNRKLIYYSMMLFISLSTLTFISCSDSKNEIKQAEEEEEEKKDDPKEEEESVIILSEADIQDYDKIYKPQEFSNMNMLRSDSKWSFVRSKQSEHFIVFWEEGFGSDPNSSTLATGLRVDIDDLLAKAETFFDININTLKFAEIGNGSSLLDRYKMQIYLLYTTEWVATGGGYDDMIGALWVNPSTCQPVGSTIAHEIGHSFQYQVYADLLATGECSADFSRGYRYGYGGNGGNAFWEQTAQWQSFQSYPNEAFESYNFSVYMENYHRHICHEWHRYASYFIHYYMTDKHGIEEVGKNWRESVGPEDPLEAYIRMHNLSISDFNAEMYEAATRFVTWDYDAIRSNGTNYIGKFNYKFYPTNDGAYQVAYANCPGSTGYNVIPLNVPEAGTVVTTTFAGLQPGSSLAADDPGQYTVNGSVRTTTKYNSSLLTRAGWRYGYVALLNSGERVYGEMNSKMSENVEFTIPEGCANLWFVVLGAPNSYTSHAWDEDESNDDQWPYTISFTNTDFLGNINFTGDEEYSDVSFTYNVSFAQSSSAYEGATVTVSTEDQTTLSKAFVLQPNQIAAAMGGKITFYAVESDGSLNATTTANGYGHWFDAAGNVCSWGDSAMVYSEFTANGFTFTIGQYPSHSKTGDTFTIRQALVYEYESGKTVQATFTFNITIL